MIPSRTGHFLSTVLFYISAIGLHSWDNIVPSHECRVLSLNFTSHVTRSTETTSRAFFGYLRGQSTYLTAALHMRTCIHHALLQNYFTLVARKCFLFVITLSLNYTYTAIQSCSAAIRFNSIFESPRYISIYLSVNT